MEVVDADQIRDHSNMIIYVSAGSPCHVNMTYLCPKIHMTVSKIETYIGQA